MGATQSNERLTSRDFYTVKPKTAQTVILTIIFVVIVIIVFIVLLRLFSANGNTCTAAPTAPLNISAQTLSATQFEINWAAVTGASAYTTYIGLNTGFTRIQSIHAENTNSPSITVTGLDLNTVYFIAITASNACGESVNSQEISFDFVE